MGPGQDRLMTDSTVHMVRGVDGQVEIWPCLCRDRTVCSCKCHA